MKRTHPDDVSTTLWDTFAKQESLNEDQLEQFKLYAQLLVQWNELSNLTTVVSQEGIIATHFQDSLALGHAIDLTTTKSLLDVGSGAGFPGVALKIKYPNLQVRLMEVNNKKIAFLDEVITRLNLADTFIYDIDWRTFLRKTEQSIELFVARASLHPDELMRMFKPSCPYNHAQLIYWASRYYELSPKEQPYFTREFTYTIKGKMSKLLFFSSSKEKQ